MMKRKMKISFSLLTAVILVLSLGAAALAEGASVSYEGGAEQFVFLPGSDYTDTDLFDGFKGVMPGDTVTQKITVTNRLSGSDTVKLYLRAQAHGALAGNPLSESVAAQESVVSMTDFLSQLSMTVKQGDRVIYQASPDELNGLAQNVLQGPVAEDEMGYRVSAACPQAQGSLVMLRDSFGEGMIPYLSKCYANSLYLHINAFDEAAMAGLEDCVFVFELAERNTDRLLDYLPRMLAWAGG